MKMNLWPIFDQLMRGLAVLLMIGGAVMMFVAVDKVIQQIGDYAVVDELERRREREYPRKEERR